LGGGEPDNSTVWHREVEGNNAANMDTSLQQKKRVSIMNMKEATFENGKPKRTHFIDD
jgi:hypothetical protein